MMFPGPYAEIIRNEAGEPLGWDNHYYDEPDYDDLRDGYDDRYYDEDDDGDVESEEEPWTEEDWIATKADERYHYEKENPRDPDGEPGGIDWI